MKNKELEDRQNTVNHLKKENRKARKMLAEYQLMMRTGASGMHKVSNGMLWDKNACGGVI